MHAGLQHCLNSSSGVWVFLYSLMVVLVGLTREVPHAQDDVKVFWFTSAQWYIMPMWQGIFVCSASGFPWRAALLWKHTAQLLPTMIHTLQHVCRTADQGGRRVICKVREPLSNQRAAVPPLPCCQVLKWAVPRWGCEYSWGSWHLIRKLMNNALGWLQHDPGRNVSLGSREQTCVDRVGKGLNMEVCPLAYCEEFLSVEGCLHVHELFLFTWSFFVLDMLAVIERYIGKHGQQLQSESL